MASPNLSFRDEQAAGHIQEGRSNAATRADLALAFLIPGVTLMLRSVMDFGLLTWMPIVKMAIAGGLILTLLLVSADRAMRERRLAFVPLLAFLAFYAFGAIAQANALLDRSKAQVFAVRVLSKHVSTGKSTTYYLQLEPWGPRTEVKEENVSHSVYDAVSVGQSVCVSLWRGALGVPWYLVRTCR